MTKQEAQNLMAYLEMGWSIPRCKLFIEVPGQGEHEVLWNPKELALKWGPREKGLLLGYILENPENYSWKKIRGGWEFEWNGKSETWEREPKTEKFFWRRLCDFGFGVD